LSDTIPSAPEPRSLPFRRPADYYAAPASEVRPIFPSWVPYGCGAASLVVILILFIGGSLAAGAKGGSLFATLFGTMQDEMRGMFTKEVTAAQKNAFDAEMNALRANIASGKVSLDRLQPFLHSIRDASMDSKITADEATRLTESARAINRGATAPSRAVAH